LPGKDFTGLSTSYLKGERRSVTPHFMHRPLGRDWRDHKFETMMKNVHLMETFAGKKTYRGK
jgi:hypothetical protein